MKRNHTPAVDTNTGVTDTGTTSTGAAAVAAPVATIGTAAITAAATIVGLIALLYCLLMTSWSVTNPISGTFDFTVPTALHIANPIETQFSKDGVQVLSTGEAQIEAAHPLVLSRILMGISTAMPFAIVIAGCIGTIVLALRLRGARPFTRALRRVVTVIGALALLTAVVTPALRSLSVSTAVTELGLPTSGEQVANPEVDAWVTPGGFSVLQDLNWPLFLLGVVLLLVAALLSRAAHMQRDTEGLV